MKQQLLFACKLFTLTGVYLFTRSRTPTNKLGNPEKSIAVLFLLENLKRVFLCKARSIKDSENQVQMLEIEIRLFKAFLKDCEKIPIKDDSLKELVAEIQDVVAEAEDVIAVALNQAAENMARNFFQRTFGGSMKQIGVAKEVRAMRAKVKNIYDKATGDVFYDRREDLRGGACGYHGGGEEGGISVVGDVSINCGSSGTSAAGDGREWLGDDREPFASYESLEQLHRFLFVLGVTHVSYSFLAIALAMIKIYSWRTWENHAKTLAFRGLLTADTSADSEDGVRMRRLSSFVSHHTSHPWSQHRSLVWLLCFTRQFWTSISQADYMALRLGFITTHQLPFTYDFHNYMLRSMEEEFRDIVGISIPLWIFAITCIVLGFHGTNIYFWISFLPAILILLVGTKLHRIVVKLAVEIMDSSQWTEFKRFNLRDELFWFANPRLLLRLIQFISFQNAFEMATYIWSMWEIRGPSCYTGDHAFLVTRLTFGVVSQFWCSFITFPLYVIVAQMGSKFKKTIVSENVRKSLHGWRKKVRTRHGPAFSLLTEPASSEAKVEEREKDPAAAGSMEECCSTSDQDVSLKQPRLNETPSFNEKPQNPVCSAPRDESSDEREIETSEDVKDHRTLLSEEQ